MLISVLTLVLIGYALGFVGGLCAGLYIGGYRD